MDIVLDHCYRKHSTKRVYILTEIERDNRGVEYVTLSEQGNLNVRYITMRDFCAQYKKLRTPKNKKT